MNRPQRAQTCLVMSVLVLMALPAPAHAKVCKDEVTAKSRSAAQYSDAERQSRARGGAMANWRDRARSTYGIAYRFWSRAEDKSIICTSTKAAGTCVAKARPCRLL
jgi:cation transport regulator ChaC